MTDYNQTQIITHVCPECASTESFKVTYSYHTDLKECVLFWAECSSCGHEECLNNSKARKALSNKYQKENDV